MILDINEGKPKKIYVNENKLDIIYEGVNIARSNGGSIMFSVNNDASDNGNRFFADTRFFGKRGDIAFGDGSYKPGTKNAYQNFEDEYTKTYSQVKLYQTAIRIVQHGWYTNAEQLLTSIQPVLGTVLAGAKRIVFSELPKEMKVRKLSASLQKAMNKLNILQGTYDRINSKVRTGKPGRPARVSDDAMLPRYTLGKVPNTNVKLIALFRLYDFNFSDAIKNGNMRTNDWVEEFTGEKALNIDKLGKGANQKEKTSITYDNGIEPDVASNFSLSGIHTNPFDAYKNNGHYKQQYGYNDENYTSVAQFMDKSIMGAAYALKKEGIDADYIIDAPSSSNFNHYYCINLANKTGIEYRQGFFKRNMLNVSVDEEKMRKNGFSNAMIGRAKEAIKDAAIKEIGSYLNECVEIFVEENYSYFNYISLTKSSREKVSKPLIVDMLRELSFYGLVNLKKESPDVTNLYKYLVNHFSEYTNGLSRSTKYDVQHITKVITEIIRTRLSKKYQMLLANIDSIITHYEEILLSSGMKISNGKKLKAVDIDKKVRPYLKDFYVVADPEMAHNKNGVVDKLRASLANKRFLIVDEDMDSGATLYYLINALKEKELECGFLDKRGPGRPRKTFINDSQITCLVNGIKI
jgi:hypothetical protein